MQKHIGVKLINAVSMTRQEYNTLRGWQLPPDENGSDDGYLVEYLDGGKPNTDAYAGYVSWSPKEVFDKAYRPIAGLNFGLAIEALKSGKRVARAGWNGKGMWLDLVLSPRSGGARADQLHYTIGGLDNGLLPWIGMKTADDCFVPWLASQTDVLAEDWQIIE
ncbi:DUF2829 domain-containing protein [Dryocola sp. LX212]